MRALATSLLIILAGCRQPSAGANGARVGVVLPFSGERAAVGANIQEAMILAQEMINAAGGIAGRPLTLDIADSHSDAARSFAAAQKLIDDDGVQILIGPEESTATLDLVASVTRADLINVQASLTSPALTGPNALLGYWFRLTPDAASVGAALAARMWADGVRKASVAYDGDDYNIALYLAYTDAFQQLGGGNAPGVPFQPQESDYSVTIAALSSLGGQSVVLPAAPGTAVAIVEQWGIQRIRPFTWYFTPDLKTPLFAQNLPSGIADNLIGISPALGDDAEAFASAFAARWSGEKPLDAAYFYYDALVVTSLAWAAASAKAGTLAPNSAIRPLLRLLSTAAGPGTLIHFSSLAQGLALVSAGQSVVYQGVTGPINFDGSGVAQRGAQTFQYWTIEKQKIVSHQ